jgi:hypothetical protein
MGNSVLGIANLVKTSGLTAGSSAVNMPPTNLQTDSGAPSMAWQTSGGVLRPSDGAWIIIRPTTRQSWRMFGIFRTNLTTGASVRFLLYLNPSTLVWDSYVNGPLPGYGQAVAVAPSDIAADYAAVEITDTSNPDGFINVPLCYAGPAWIPAIGHTWQTTFGRDSVVDEMQSRGGQEYPTYRYQQRRWEIAFDSLSGAEVWQSAEELDRLSRYGGNILFVPDLASGTLASEAVFGRVTVTGDVSYIAGVANLHAWKFRCKERL